MPLLEPGTPDDRRAGLYSFRVTVTSGTCTLERRMKGESTFDPIKNAEWTVSTNDNLSLPDCDLKFIGDGTFNIEKIVHY